MHQPNPYAPPQSDAAFGSGPGNEHPYRVLAVISAPFRWLFAPERRPGPWRAIVWWELRRLPVNLLIGVYGITCLVVLLWAITSSQALEPGEDAFEPFAILMVMPVLFNICYTLGWLVEVPARLANPSLSPRFGPLLMKLGLGFSFCIIGCPAAMWVAYRCLQLVRVFHSE